ncbi:FAD/NAD(P)-binding protein [Achromobacter pestifer]
MPTSTLPHVVIIGGGFAGTVTAIKLARLAPRPLRLTVIENRDQLGRGIAYSTRNTAHVVNGPAKNFSMYPEQPEHLANWLQHHAARDGWRPPPDVPYPDSFPPRHLYGDYVQSELESALSEARHPITFKHVTDRALDLEAAAGKQWGIRLASGRLLYADDVVLATGLFPLSLARGDVQIDPQLIAAGRVIDDIWAPGPAVPLAQDQDVLVIGTNLSALDAMIHANAQGFRGTFHSVSRRGLLVATRRDVAPWPAFLDPQALPQSLRAVLRLARAARKGIAQAGEDWQRLAGSIRPHLPALWAQADNTERQRFIRHLRPYWELGLHRAAPESGAWLQSIDAADRHRKLTGRILRVAPAVDGRVTVTWRPRGDAAPQTLHVDRVFNTRGFEFDWRRIDDPLVRNLVSKGYVTPHDTGFGIAANPSTGQVLPRAGSAARLYAVGHPLRGAAWESNAIGEQVAGATATAQAVARSWVEDGDNGSAARIRVSLREEVVLP